MPENTESMDPSRLAETKSLSSPANLRSANSMSIGHNQVEYHGRLKDPTKQPMEVATRPPPELPTGESTEEEASTRTERLVTNAKRTHFWFRPKAEERTVPPELFRLWTERKDEIATLYSNVEYWHGTGNKQQREGEVVDVLDCIIGQGGFAPAADNFDMTRGGQFTISVTDRRMYARAYAQMYLPEGETLGYEYLPSDYWFRRYIVGSVDPIAAANDGALYAWRKAKEKMETASIDTASPGFRANYQSWISKVRLGQVPKGMGILEARSNIPGNFPLLFGIKNRVVTPVPIGSALSRYETRTTDPIPLSGLTHIEVPLAHVTDVQERLRSKGIVLPILPLELGEIQVSRLSPDQLVRV